MRRLYLVATAAFWVVFAALWALQSAAPDPPAVATEPTAERAFTLAQIAPHDRATDCWMAIDGQVYDLTPYLPRHPADDEVLLAWCGREASEAYRTKTRGRPHSARADGLLPPYRIGSVASAR